MLIEAVNGFTHFSRSLEECEDFQQHGGQRYVSLLLIPFLPPSLVTRGTRKQEIQVLIPALPSGSRSDLGQVTPSL